MRTHSPARLVLERARSACARCSAILAGAGMLGARACVMLAAAPTTKLFALVVAAVLCAPARGSRLTVASDLDCALKGAWSSGGAELRQLAFEWSKTHDISRWEFAALGGNCSHARYDTRIHLPDVFSALWKHNSIEMHVEKHVCVHGLSLRETVVVSRLPFVDAVSIRVEGTAFAEARLVSLTAEYAVAVPWYLAIVESAVQQHVKESVLEYLDILKQDVCA